MENKEEVVGKILYIIDKIRPFLQRDGGDVEFINISADGVVEIELLGACSSCASSDQTVKLGIEMALMQEVPEVKEVIAINEPTELF